MRIPKTLQAALLALVAATSAFAQSLPPTVSSALARAGIPEAAAGIYVARVDGTVLTTLNDSTPFNPASTMKLVTTNAALERLGPTYQWKTEAYATGGLAAGVLHGDLIIKGGGDPELVLENLWLFLRRIRAAGVREIRGDLILDRSVFAEQAHDPAAFDGEPLRPYNVGPDALLLNFKSIALRFLPDPARGTVHVQTEPPMTDYPIRLPRLANGACGDWRARLQADIDARGAHFAGTYAASCGTQTWHVHPHPMTHTEYFERMFRHFWADLDGSLQGRVRAGVVPEDAWPLVQWESAPLAEVIRDINKFSNNVMARQVLLTLAHEVTGLPGDAVHGSAVVRTWLADKGIEAPELVVDNGSGLSREARISARTLGRMLVAAYQAPFMPEFMASMPLVGLDGTMRRRMTDEPVSGRAHVKTGTLEQVRAIAGYVLAASGARYAVVCVINHERASRTTEVQDALLQWVYERG